VPPWCGLIEHDVRHSKAGVLEEVFQPYAQQEVVTDQDGRKFELRPPACQKQSFSAAIEGPLASWK
jgi:hypothetical protein